MAFPTTDTRNLNDIASVTYREIIDAQHNLITESDEKMFQILIRNGAIEPYTGGDEFTVTAMIAGGSSLAEIDPADENPGGTLLATGQQTLAPARYKIYKRPEQVNWATHTVDLNAGERKVGDVITAKLLAANLTMMEDFVDQDATPGGFFQTTSVLPSAGTTNAKAMLVDLTNTFGGVPESTYTKWKPIATAISSGGSAGANLITKDLTKLINDTDRGVEGMCSDIITNQIVWEKIVDLKASNNVASVGPASVDYGARNTTEHSGIPIHWTRHLSDTAHTSWDNTSTAGDTATHPVFAIDFARSLRLRIKLGVGMPGDPIAMIYREGPMFMQPTTHFVSQRLATMGQWYFARSRRTSGTLQGLTGTIS